MKQNNRNLEKNAERKSGQPVKQINLHHDVTVVTAYFDIGSFEKGDKSNIYTPNQYTKWMSTFKFLDNPLYVYVDNRHTEEIFKDIRKDYRDRTKIVLLNKKDMWAFKLNQNISDIFSQPNYPRHLPNTVYPDYSCAMHAKYEVMHKSVEENAFKTEYFAWHDIGLFRDSLNETQPKFAIQLPPKFALKRVAYNQVYSPRKRMLKDIIEGNEVWVSGSFFIAEKKVMRQWVSDYMFFTEEFIRQKWMSTDQQVIYGMSQPLIQKDLDKTPVAIQQYHAHKPNDYFGLGYLCRQVI